MNALGHGDIKLTKYYALVTFSSVVHASISEDAICVVLETFPENIQVLLYLR